MLNLSISEICNQTWFKYRPKWKNTYSGTKEFQMWWFQIYSWDSKNRSIWKMDFIELANYSLPGTAPECLNTLLGYVPIKLTKA